MIRVKDIQEVTKANAIPPQDPEIWRRYGMELIGPPMPATNKLCCYIVDKEGEMIKVLIEAETGSCEKKVYDEKTLTLTETHHTSLHYPYPYGFITGTTTVDGDGVDCYVITKDQLKTGTIVECEAIGLLEQFEDGEVDHKVLASLPGQKGEFGLDLLNELRNFIYKIFEEFPDTTVSVGRILSRQIALDYISRCENK